MAKARKKRKTKQVEALLDNLAEQTGAAMKSLPESDKPPEKLTVYCRVCDEDGWVVPNSLEALDPKDAKPINHAMANDTSMYLDCPTCGCPMIEGRYYGGFEFYTRELGKVPSGSFRDAGIRISRTHGSDPTDFVRVLLG